MDICLGICIKKLSIMRGSVGMLIGSQALKSLNNIEKMQLRMMVAKVNDSPSTTVISCYSPTN